MNLIGIKAQKASMHKINSKMKNKVLNDYAKLLDKEKKLITNQNLKDVKFAKLKKLSENLIDRLQLDEKKLNSIKNSTSTKREN